MTNKMAVPYIFRSLWAAGQLAGSPAEGMAKVFMWVPVAIAMVPWKYVLDKYVLNRR